MRQQESGSPKIRTRKASYIRAEIEGKRTSIIGDRTRELKERTK